MNTINKLYQAVVDFWNQTSMTSKVLIGLIVGLFVINFWYAASTGIWFLNPFNPVTWAGDYLKARIFYGSISAIAGALSYWLGMRLANEVM